ncbi:phosphatidate phosphatase LPIN1 [Gracilinanus agilis]|uniref:phosphatidate phosphatase LPIN1 n=1 Tax=Gracilinanus agilis TaxID=191870 RepID=UPI001CFE0D8F|nr:phosphatidate phosphatase LPIN1 [Gracilinanus agilis]
MEPGDSTEGSSLESSRGKSLPESAWSWIPMMKDPGWIRNVWTSNLNAQTMNYVGQLAGQVFVTVKELYKGLNPATLSGCIDIIVVRQPNGNLQCSPFHVRFGKMGVLRSREKVVDIEINGESVDLHMKLGDNGEAFFVQEMDNGQEVIPLHLATSPILSEGASRMEAQLKRGALERGRGLEPGSVAQTQAAGELLSVKKRRKRRRKCQLDSLKRDDGLHTSEDEDLFPIEMSSDEDLEPPLDRALVHDVPTFRDEAPLEGPSPAPGFPPSPCYSSSDREWALPQSEPLDCKRLPPHVAVVAEGGLSNSCPPQSSHFHSSESPSASRPSTPKSDSELVSKSMERGLPKSNPEMLWLWGELPQAAKTASPHKAKDGASRSFSEKMLFRVIQSESSETLSDVSPSAGHGEALSPEDGPALPEAPAGAEHVQDVSGAPPAPPEGPPTAPPAAMELRIDGPAANSLSREVIEKKPEKFKVQCLTDIKNLFLPNTEPFYAAFGNRPADVYSYKQVGVTLNRIFTVNPKGELVQEHAKTNISSYVRLCEVVDHVFPLLKRSHSSDFPCSDTFSNFTFWREPLPPFENQDIHSASANTY